MRVRQQLGVKGGMKRWEREGRRGRKSNFINIPAPNGTYENFSLLEASAWRNLDKENTNVRVVLAITQLSIHCTCQG